jgi:hypothetical protein
MIAGIVVPSFDIEAQQKHIRNREARAGIEEGRTLVPNKAYLKQKAAHNPFFHEVIQGGVHELCIASRTLERTAVRASTGKEDIDSSCLTPNLMQRQLSLYIFIYGIANCGISCYSTR